MAACHVHYVEAALDIFVFAFDAAAIGKDSEIELLAIRAPVNPALERFIVG